MTRIEYENVSVPIIVQQIGGNLRLRGRSGGLLIVDGDDAHVEQIGEGQPYVVRAGGDARITVPEDVDVSVQNVGGEARITDLDGDADVQTIGSDLVLRSVQNVQVKTVGSDLRIKRVDGNVTVETVGADATIREIGGAVWVATVGADLYVRNIQGSCVVENVGSDLVLSIDFLPDQEYRFTAGSDILCRIQPDTNARLILPAETHVQLDVDAEIIASEDGEQQIVILGDGSATVNINNADTLRLVGEEEDYMINFGVQIEEELDARLSSLEEKLSRQLEGLDERIQAKSEQFASQAEKFARRAQRQAERAAERVRRSLDDRKQTKHKRGPGPRRMVIGLPDHKPPHRVSDPVSEQERLMILEMVQDNKISIEEAERLLSALES